MKKIILFFSIIYFLSLISSGQTPLSGTFSADTVIQSSLSPYLVSSNIIVNAGTEFYVEPGTVIYLNPGIYITVNGRLVLAGTQTDSIRMYPNVGGSAWACISASSGDIDINYTHIVRASQVISAYYGDIRVNNCRFDSITGGDGIAIHYADTVIIENSTFNGIKNTGKIDAIDCDGIEYGLISNNRFTNWFDDAIDIGTAATNLTVCYNYVENCNFGLSIGEASSATAFRNVFVKNYGGMQSHTSAVLTAYNNTLYNNTAGIECYHGTAVGTGGIANVRNTIFSKCTSGNYLLQPSSNLTVSYCCYDTDSLPGLNNVFGDPFFVDTLVRDFHLISGSVCINAGDPADPLDTNGNYIDIGAFEYYDPLSGKELNRSEICIFPNPFNDYIKLGSIKNYTGYIIYDTTGKTVISGNIISGMKIIPTASWPDGIYLCKFVSLSGDAKGVMIIKR